MRGIAWAAGFFEGEGCTYCCVKKNNGRRYGYLRLCVSQKEREPLDTFASIVGGKVLGPYENKGAKYEWYANNKEAERVVSLLEPYLLTRRTKQLAEARRKVEEIRCERRSATSVLG